MAYKNIEDSRAAIRRHYYANRQYYINKAMRRKQDIRDLIRVVKEVIPCWDCDNHYPYYVMDFDHIENKTGTINSFIDHCSVKKLEDEIAKCELVCSNCHRARTYKRIIASNSL